MADKVTCRNCKHNVLHEEDGEQYHWCEIDNDNYDVDEPRKCTAYMAATKADRIRQMSDEELANVLSWISERKTADGWLDWLKQEVEGCGAGRPY